MSSCRTSNSEVHEHTISRDDALLQGIVQANKLLLTTTDLAQAMPEALAILGDAIAVDRAYIAEIVTLPHRIAQQARLRYEWCRSGIMGHPNSSAWEALVFERYGLTAWLDEFAAGRLIHRSISDASPPEQAFLQASEITTVLLVPVFVEQQLWGHVGLDRCAPGRIWSATEQTLMQSVADTLGSAIARLQNLAARQRSEQRLHKLANTLPGVLFQCELLDSEHLAFSYLSEGCQRVLGVSAATAKTSLLTDLTHPAERDSVRQMFLLSANTLQRLELEWRMQTPAGSEKWVQASAMPEAIGASEVRWHGVLFDVSDRKAANAQLKLQEAFLRSIYDGVANRIFALNIEPDGTIAYSGHNRAAEMATGRTSASVEGVSPTTMFGPAAGAEIEAVCRRCIAERSPITQQEHLLLNGIESWVLTTFNPLKDDTGRIHRIIGTSFDITPLKLAQAELQEQACLSNFRSEIDSLLTRGKTLRAMSRGCCNVTTRSLKAVWAALWLYDEPTQSLKLMAKSGQLDSKAGLERVAIGASLPGLIASEREIYFTNDLPGEPYARESWAGLPNLVAFAGYPLIVDEELVGVFALAAGYTLSDHLLKTLSLVADEIALGLKRKQTETQLHFSEKQLRQQAGELQSALQELQRTQAHLVQSEKMSSLGQLVAGVAHEINNPVNFIYGNLSHARTYAEDLLHIISLFEVYYPSPHPDLVEEMETMDLEFVKTDLPKLLNSMKVGAERIQGIVSSLRTFSRMDEAEMKAVDIHDGIESTILILQNRLKGKGDRAEIQIIRHYGDLPQVECYAGQLNQVFMNLLSNAVDALDEVRVEGDRHQPTINIKTQLIEKQRVKIQIQDNGPGIRAEVLTRLFDPFFTTKPIGQGTGMGLSISYQIITEKHGGEIQCDSQVGGGTAFTITIPLAQS